MISLYEFNDWLHIFGGKEPDLFVFSCVLTHLCFSFFVLTITICENKERYSHGARVVVVVVVVGVVVVVVVVVVVGVVVVVVGGAVVVVLLGGVGLHLSIIGFL